MAESVVLLATTCHRRNPLAARGLAAVLARVTPGGVAVITDGMAAAVGDN